MALTEDRNLNFYASAELIDLPVDDNVLIYKGAFVGLNAATGYARPLRAGDIFMGIAYRQVDNTQAGHVAGGKRVRLQQVIDMVHALPGVSNALLGSEVYASDDATLTFVPTNNSRIGRVVAVEGSNTARVRCAPVSTLGGALENEPVLTLADENATLGLSHMNRTLLIAPTAARTLTLPPTALARAGAWFRLVKTINNVFAVTLDGNGAETIDGAATFAGVDAQYDCVLVMSTGTEWIILNRDLA